MRCGKSCYLKKTRIRVGAVVLAAACGSCSFAWRTAYIRGVRLGLGGGVYPGSLESLTEILGSTVMVEGAEVANIELIYT